MAMRLLRGHHAPGAADDAGAITRLCAIVPLGDVQRNVRRCMLVATTRLSSRRNGNASHSHVKPSFRALRPHPASKHHGQVQKAHRRERATRIIAYRQLRPRHHIATSRPPHTPVTRLPDVTRGRRRAPAADQPRMAMRLLRGHHAPGAADDAGAITRLCARLPLGDVQRNVQRCMLVATYTTQDIDVEAIVNPNMVCAVYPLRGRQLRGRGNF